MIDKAGMIEPTVCGPVKFLYYHSKFPFHTEEWSVLFCGSRFSFSSRKPPFHTCFPAAIGHPFCKFNIECEVMNPCFPLFIFFRFRKSQKCMNVLKFSARDSLPYYPLRKFLMKLNCALVFSFIMTKFYSKFCWSIVAFSNDKFLSTYDFYYINWVCTVSIMHCFVQGE